MPQGIERLLRSGDRPRHGRLRGRPAIAVASLIAIVASTACLGGRAGYRASYLRHRDTGPYYGLYSHILLPNDSEETTVVAGTEFAVLASAYPQLEYSPALVAAPAGVLEVDGGLLMPTLQLGLQFGRGLSLVTAACYGAYGVHLQAFACARWSTAGWLAADINLGTNAVEALDAYLSHRLFD